MIEFQTENVALISAPLKGMGGALVTFSNPRDLSVGAIERVSAAGHRQGFNYRKWGRDDNLPHYREQIIADNNIVPSLIQTKRDITFGTGLFAYKKVFVSDGGKVNIVEVPMPAKAQEFFDHVDIDCYLMEALNNYFKHANVFTEFVLSNDGKAVTDIKLHDCKYVRLGEQNDNGIIEQALISGNWATSPYAKDKLNKSDRIVTPVPMYRRGADQKHFMYHTGDSLFGDGYYYSPHWWGDANWILISNDIPIYHMSNIENGYNIRFHIKVPEGYFYTQPKEQTAEALKKAATDAADKKRELMQRINELLAGKRKVGRALFTEYKVNNIIGKEYPGIVIEPINVDLKDEALLKLFDKSNTANISSQGIHPTLANIETQGKLSSGSEMRNAYNVYLGTKTVLPRRIVLKAIDMVKKINGWDADIYFAFGNTEIVTLDESPTGTKESAVTDEPVSDAA